MKHDADNWWRVERAVWLNQQQAIFDTTVRDFLWKETYFPESFDDSPMITALERMRMLGGGR